MRERGREKKKGDRKQCVCGDGGQIQVMSEICHQPDVSISLFKVLRNPCNGLSLAAGSTIGGAWVSHHLSSNEREQLFLLSGPLGPLGHAGNKLTVSGWFAGQGS